MNKIDAVDQVQKSLHNMEAIMGEPVFTEWALIVKSGGKWGLAAYEGPRKPTFTENFQADMKAMRDTLNLEQISVGDYSFSHEGHGSGFDAYMCVAENALLLFNHLDKNTTDIVQNPQWREAQIHFATLLEAFLASPLDMRV